MELTVGAMTIRAAALEEFDTVLEVLGESVRWLQDRGSDQWSTWRTWRTKMRPALERGDVWLLRDGGDVIGTIALESAGDPDFWSMLELGQPAGYVSKLAVRRSHAGRELGALMLEWAGDRVFRRGGDWVRLDAWKTNGRLHDYYRDRGWRYLRLAGTDVRHSGALFQRRAVSLSSSSAQLLREVPPMPVLETTQRTLVAADNASGTWQPDHVHEGGLVVDYRHAGRSRAVFVDFMRYRILDDAGEWVLEAAQVGQPWERQGRVVSASFPSEEGTVYVVSHQDGNPCQMVIAGLADTTSTDARGLVEGQP